MTAEQEMLRLSRLVKELVDFSNPKKYQPNKSDSDLTG
jgi:hypothetical protein